MEPARQPNPWYDFALGLGGMIAGYLLFGIVAAVLSPFTNPRLVLGLGTVLEAAVFVAVLAKRRPFIAIGMVSVAALPLLLGGACALLFERPY